MLTTISVALNGSNQLVVTDTALGGQNDAITIQSNIASNVFVISSLSHTIATSIAGATGHGTSLVTIPFAAVTGSQIIPNLGAGDDSLTVDYSLGAFAKTIVYDGCTDANDSLTLVNGTVTSVTHQGTAATPGSATITGNSGINYSGVEQVTDNLSTTPRTFSGNSSTDVISLADVAGSSLLYDLEERAKPLTHQDR